VTVWPVTEI